MKIDLFLAWYDLWIGVYVALEKRTVYLCPVPCVVIRIRF